MKFKIFITTLILINSFFIFVNYTNIKWIKSENAEHQAHHIFNK